MSLLKLLYYKVMCFFEQGRINTLRERNEALRKENDELEKRLKNE